MNRAAATHCRTTRALNGTRIVILSRVAGATRPATLYYFDNLVCEPHDGWAFRSRVMVF